MKPQPVLIAEETITPEDEGLSITRPVSVVTHLFDQADGTPASRVEVEDLICVGAFPVPGRHTVAAHDHGHCEICLTIAGSALHCTDVYQTALKRGSALVISPGKVHAIKDIDGMCAVRFSCLLGWLMHDVQEMWALDGGISLFLAAGLLGGGKSKWVPQCELNEDEFQTCVRELKDLGLETSRDAPSQVYMRHAIGKFMFTLGRAFVRNGLGVSRQPGGPKLQAALKYIEDAVQVPRGSAWPNLRNTLAWCPTISAGFSSM